MKCEDIFYEKKKKKKKDQVRLAEIREHYQNTGIPVKNTRIPV